MSIVEAIAEQVGRLNPEQQQRVLAFARSVGAGKRVPPKGTRVEDLLRFAGTIPPEDLAEMEKAIEDGCEQVSPNGW